MHRLALLAATTVFVLAPLTTALAADHAVAIKGFKFVPAELSVAAGDTVTFTNEDAAPHTATADNGGFDTGRLGRGQSSTVTIAAAGTFTYTCLFHPMMKGTVRAR